MAKSDFVSSVVVVVVVVKSFVRLKEIKVCHQQGDQIRRFLNNLVTNYLQKVAKLYGYFLDLIEKITSK